MTDYSPSPVVNSGTTENRAASDATNQSKPAGLPTGIPGLPAKPVFSNDNINTSASPDSSSNGGGFAVVADKKDDTDFAKPVTPVSEANGHTGEIDHADNDKPAASSTAAVPVPLPLTEEPETLAPAPAESESSKPAEPASSSFSIPTANAPSIALAAPTAATEINNESPSLVPGLPAKPVEPVASSSLTATNTLSGEKRKAEDSVDAPAANKNDKPAEPAEPRITALFGTGPVSSSIPAKPPAPEPETGIESPAKKLKTDSSADVDAAEAAPASAADPALSSTLEVNLGPAPSAAEIASTSTEAPAAAGVKKSTSRAKREKKPLPPVGKTARKTRSQGPA